MGNAIVPAIMGDKMLYNYMLYILPLNVAVYTWGVIILIPRGNNSGSALKNLLNPIFVSIIIGALLGLTGMICSVIYKIYCDELCVMYGTSCNDFNRICNRRI